MREPYCRSARASLFTLKPIVTAALIAAVVVSAAIHLVSLLVPGLRPVFRTFPLNSDEWLLLIGLSASIIPAVELFKLVQRLVVGARERPA